MMEIILCLATIGQKFRLELVPNHPVTIYPAMSLRPKDGIKVVVGTNRTKSFSSVIHLIIVDLLQKSVLFRQCQFSPQTIEPVATSINLLQLADIE